MGTGTQYATCSKRSIEGILAYHTGINQVKDTTAYFLFMLAHRCIKVITALSY